MSNIDRYTLIKWLNTNIGLNYLVFDKILNIHDNILNYLDSNNIKLKYNKDIFLIQLIKYIYINSIA